MLYFTEVEETLPDIYEVNDQFEREYDSAAYEKKIACLLRNACRRNRQESPEGENRWKQAIADLRKEDHYLLVMVDQSLQPSAAMGWGIGVGISIVISLLVMLWIARDEKGLIPKWVLGWISDDPLIRKLQFSCNLGSARSLVRGQICEIGCLGRVAGQSGSCRDICRCGLSRGKCSSNTGGSSICHPTD